MFQRQPWMQRAGEFPGSDAEYHGLLARAVFSGGLGPRVVEARWEGIKHAFHDFDPGAVAAMSAEDVARLLSDPGVIRNRRKIEAVIENAGRFLDIVAEHGAFHEYLASVGAPSADGTSDLDAAATELARSFRHLGPASAALFLFSAGWRVGSEETGAVGGDVPVTRDDGSASPEEISPAASRRASRAKGGVVAAA